MAHASRDLRDGALDVCRHRRRPSQFCPMCDRAEVGFEPISSWTGVIDLRDEPSLHVRDTAPKHTGPSR